MIKLIAGIIFALVLALGLWFGWYLTQKGANFDIVEGSGQSEEDQDILKGRFFLITIPKGWREAIPPAGAHTMLVNVDEFHDDPAFQQINFKTYITMTPDSEESRGNEGYIEYVQTNLTEASGFTFVEEGYGSTDETDYYQMRAELNQNNIDFVVGIVLYFEENTDRVWVVTLNTAKSKWEEYKGLWQDVIDSFTIRKYS